MGETERGGGRYSIFRAHCYLHLTMSCLISGPQKVRSFRPPTETVLWIWGVCVRMTALLRAS